MCNLGLAFRVSAAFLKHRIGVQRSATARKTSLSASYSTQELPDFQHHFNITPMSKRNILVAEADSYDGVLIDGDNLPESSEIFQEMLSDSLAEWRATRRKGVWLKVPRVKSQLICIAVNQGFDFHSAEPGYVLMTKWLPDTENKLPPGASHQVGVGAFVMNERQQVLVVQEKYGPLRGKGIWKLPTGLVGVGEDITLAAEREVLEETGIKAVFESVLAMRQAHAFAFGGKSDFFFVLALKPKESQQNDIVVQEDELEAAKWMDLEEFESIPFMASRPLLQQIMTVCLNYAKTGKGGLTGKQLSEGSRDSLLFWGEETRQTDAEDTWIGVE